MANVYCDSVAYTAVPQFAISHAYVSTSNGGRGDYIRQLAAPSVGNERVFRCTTSGTTAGSEPTWTLTKNGTTTSGTATFTECTGQEADQGAGGAQWKAPHARLQAAVADTWYASGDNCFFGNDHAETQASAMSITNTQAVTNVICVSPTSSIPPVSADAATGGQITTTGASDLTLHPNGDLYCSGLIINCGSGSSGSAAYNIGHGGSSHTFVNCKINSLHAGNANFPNINGSVVFDNTTMRANNSGTESQLSGDLYWRNTPNAIDPAGVVQTVYGLFYLANGSHFYAEGCDFSFQTSAGLVTCTNSVPIIVVYKDCKFASVANFAKVLPFAAGSELIAIRAGSPGTKEVSDYKYTAYGVLSSDTAVVRTNGASDGTIPQAHKIATYSNATFGIPFLGFPVTIWNTVLQNNVNVTLEGIASPVSFSALPNNDDFWFDAEYLGASGAPLGSFASGTKANILATGTALTASTQAWDSKATARANSTAYNQGDVFKLASNSGRLFFCTTAGTTAGSEPGGYATAIDGGSVTDGTATFKAGWRFKQTITLASPQPQMVGPITVYPKMAKASATLYLDPLITLS